MEGYGTWNPFPVDETNVNALHGEYHGRIRAARPERIYLSSTYRIPFAPSSSEKSSTGGSRVTLTFSCLWRRTGGMSLNELGVDPTKSLCSSGDTYVGVDVINVTAGMLA
jgi:hypothetical protein